MLLVVFPMLAEAACPDQAAVASYLADFKALRTSKAFGPDLTLADAECARDSAGRGDRSTCVVAKRTRADLAR